MTKTVFRKTLAITFALALIITLNLAMIGKIAWMWFWANALLALATVLFWNRRKA